MTNQRFKYHDPKLRAENIPTVEALRREIPSMASGGGFGLEEE
jgi:hypothetical protein